MAPNKKSSNVIVSESFQVLTEKTFRSFIESDDFSYEFPSNLSNLERAWIHIHSKTIGLNSKSHGKEPDRRITISKPDRFKFNKDTCLVSLSQDISRIMNEFLKKFPLTLDSLDNVQMPQKSRQDFVDNNMGQLTFGFPQVPLASFSNDLIQFRMSLPIWPMREQLMETIVSNQVTIVCGETGCGKTTQLPQFILDYTKSVNEKCRVVCTQPRRISAVSVAERVSTERNEKIGQTVGYHIRLESCVGPKTVLIYCTNGILLRTLMSSGDACLQSYTHIIVDEIHERDRFSDFLLICLRESLVRNPNLRLILMSATANVSMFEKYFNNPPIIHVCGRLYPVKEYFLEDVLSLTGYNSPAMATHKIKLTSQQMTVKSRLEMHWQLPITTYTAGCSEINTEMNESIEECIENGTDDSFAQLLQLVLSDHVPINYQHSETGMTGLMAAAHHGNIDFVKQLLTFGAEVKVKNRDHYSAYDLACARQHIEVANMLQFHESMPNYNSFRKVIDTKQSKTKEELLELYQHTISDNIDYDLILSLILFVHLNNKFGSILIFLPGYDDIVITKDKILNDPKFANASYQIFTLHSSMQMSDQNKVFNLLPNKRKIILSTNIAETSITINDVVFVVDSGKVKEKCYDAITGVCSLQSTWISRACSTQRAGRAGRTQPGVCFHLFSEYRYNTMEVYSSPEILRMPLHELCLQTKMLAPENMLIADFLERALEPPSSMAVDNAIQHLQDIDALNEDEMLTPLGRHLVDIPVEPRLAKMLIYSVVFKCLDPILTIVACMAYRDPFVLPNTALQKHHALNMRGQFSTAFYSDHLIFLRVFQAWQDARIAKKERQFCNKYFVSSAIMEMIVGTRTQLLAQLRASGLVKTKPPGDIRDLNTHAGNWPIVKAVLASGLYPNIACINRSSVQLKTKKEKKVFIHQCSSLNSCDRLVRGAADNAQTLQKIPTNWLIYDELSRTGNNYNIKSLTCVSLLSVVLLLDLKKNKKTSYDKSDESEFNYSFTLNDWLQFEGPLNVIKLIITMREKLCGVINKKINFPQKILNVHDDNLINAIANVLLKEDDASGLPSPQGIGQRPKMLMVNMYPAVNDISSIQGRQQNSAKAMNQIPEVLRFKHVSLQDYNKFNPQIENYSGDELAIAGNGLKPTAPNELDLLSNNVDYTLDFQVNPFYSNCNFQWNFCSSNLHSANNVQCDFDANGINVAEEEDLEGAHVYGTSNFLSSWIRMNCASDHISYYVVKASGMKCIDISISKKTWIFSPQTEHKLLKVLQSGKIVMLIITVNNSGAFQGLARLLGGPPKNETNMLACPIEWFSRADIPYTEIIDIKMPTNSDGMELPACIGVELCLKFTNCNPQPPMQLEPSTIPKGRAIRGGFK